MLEMINTIVKNTRILGFNVGIEAARSGEYGRGFAEKNYNGAFEKMLISF
ncbi:MAG TPA: methyl-accepting chemotaxis protein [Ureibacillus sp.]|nr:methyl-accepting chemotaxis protein [Ureibacillus sp.]